MNGFNGKAFDASLPHGKTSGQLRVTHDGVVLDGDDGRVELPLTGLSVSLGGARDRLVFFRHPSCPGVSIYTSDRRILKDPALANRGPAAARIALLTRKLRAKRLVELSAAGLVVAAVAALFLLRKPLVSAAVKRIPAAWEVALGDAVFAQIKLTKREISAPEVAAGVRALTGPVLKGIPNRPYEFFFHVFADPTVNAFALPGGHVVINTGLLLAAQSPEEVAGVIAHELGHVMHRHALRQVVGALGSWTLIRALLGDLTGFAKVLTDKGAVLLVLKYSRNCEREADAAAWEYLLNAGVNPRGLITFLERLEQQRPANSTTDALEPAVSMLSTHPRPRERLRTLREKAGKLENGLTFLTFDLSYPEFRATVTKNAKERITTAR